MTSFVDKRDRLHEMLKDFDTAMLMTRTADGRVHVRPMAVAKLDDEGDVVFVSNKQSPKVSEINDDPSVVVTFQSAAQFASIAGQALVMHDQAMIDELWSEAWKVWFPGGKDDQNICFIRVRASEGEYWDNAGAKGMKYAFEAVKAYLKGRTPDVDSNVHGKVNL
jgi:general stress protein 26